MKCIAKLQILLQFELEDANDLLQKVDIPDNDDIDDTDELEE